MISMITVRQNALYYFNICFHLAFILFFNQGYHSVILVSPYHPLDIIIIYIVQSQGSYITFFLLLLMGLSVGLFLMISLDSLIIGTYFFFHSLIPILHLSMMLVQSEISESNAVTP